MPRDYTVENRVRFPGNILIARIHIHEMGTPPSASHVKYLLDLEPHVYDLIDFNWGLTQECVDEYVARRALCVTSKS